MKGGTPQRENMPMARDQGLRHREEREKMTEATETGASRFQRCHFHHGLQEKEERIDVQSILIFLLLTKPCLLSFDLTANSGAFSGS